MYTGMFGYEGISFLRADGELMARRDVVNAIDHLHWTFYTTDAFGNVGILETVHPLHGDPYVKTWRDNVVTDNLLQLPRCF
jgi:hypothetical protein